MTIGFGPTKNAMGTELCSGVGVHSGSFGPTQSPWVLNYLQPIMNARYEKYSTQISVPWLRTRLKKRREYLYGQQKLSINQ